MNGEPHSTASFRYADDQVTAPAQLVPDDAKYLSVKECYYHFGQLAAKFRDTIDFQIRHPRFGELRTPVYRFSISPHKRIENGVTRPASNYDFSSHHLRAVGVHPNEWVALTSMYYEALYYCQHPELLQEGNMTMDYFILDIEGLEVHEPLSGIKSLTVTDLMLNNWRPTDPGQQVEYGFPFNAPGGNYRYGRHKSMLKPGVQAIIEYNRQIEIYAHQFVSLFSGHNSHLGYMWALFGGNGFNDRLGRVFNDSMSRRGLRSPDPIHGDGEKQLWSNVLDYHVSKKNWLTLENFSRTWTGGRSMFEYLSSTNRGLVGTIGEVPLLTPKTLKPEFRGLTLGESIDLRDEILRELEPLITRARQALSTVKPHKNSIMADVRCIVGLDQEWIPPQKYADEQHDKRVSPTRAFEIAIVESFYAGRTLGMARLALAFYEFDPQLQEDIAVAIHRIGEEIEKHVDVEIVPPANAIRGQLDVMTLGTVHSQLLREQRLNPQTSRLQVRASENGVPFAQTL